MDEADYELVRPYRWVLLTGRGTLEYAVHWICKDGKKTALLMHRLIAGAAGYEPGQLVDHIDGNGLNNRRGNLRGADLQQNQANSRVKKNSKTGYKGVALEKQRPGKAERYVGIIVVRGVRQRCGTYDTPEEAARAYDDAARAAWREFACVNFPRPGERGARWSR